MIVALDAGPLANAADGPIRPQVHREPEVPVRAFYETVWTEGQLERAMEFLAEDLIDHDPLPFPGRGAGAAGLVQVAAMIRSGIPDLRRTVEDQIAEGDRVVTRFTDQGTHQGDLLGVPATGHEVAVRAINIEVVGDGLIREVWHIEDLVGLLAQLGRPII